MTTPNPAQKPRRGRRVSVSRPSRSLSRCEHTRINPHPPSPAIRPRGGAERAHPFAHSRGKRRGAFAPPCGLPTPLALASAARARRRRNAARLVASSTSARDYHHPPFAASIPRLTILFPRPSPQARHEAEVKNSPCQRRSQRLAREEVASTGEVSRERRDDVGDAPDEPPDSAGPRRPPGSPAAPRKKKPTRSRVFPAPSVAPSDDAATTPAATRRRLVFSDGGEFDSPEGGAGGSAGARAGGTTTPASPPMTRGRASGGKEPKTPPVSKIKSMPR